MNASPTILVFDSGFGGLTVLREVMRVRGDADFVYCADSAAFPYGDLSEAELVARVLDVFEMLMGEYRPDLAVVACNTASTAVLPHLRARYPIPFVGTVPAIKPAALASGSKLISVFATPGTVARDYTQDLIERFAEGCEVTLVGSRLLAGIAEAKLKGENVSDDDILAELRPCFVEKLDGRRTDQIVLACTHYPLLLDDLNRLALWPVHFVDPAPAIARRVTALIGERQHENEGNSRVAVFTGPVPESAAERDMFAQFELHRLVSAGKPFPAGARLAV